MAVNPGPGSIIYRGLAAVIVGGVVVAMIFSLLLLPSLMRLMTGWRAPVAQATRSLKSGDVPRAA
jgi:Cu/Ag efflux pump CusA